MEAAGGRIEKPKMSVGDDGFISLVVDTEGNMLGYILNNNADFFRLAFNHWGKSGADNTIAKYVFGY